jgi:hypothetical protein
MCVCVCVYMYMYIYTYIYLFIWDTHGWTIFVFLRDDSLSRSYHAHVTPNLKKYD